MCTLCINVQFFFHCQKESFNGWFLKLGCRIFSLWHYLKHSNICTTGQVLKIGNIYTYQEGSYVDIVRLLNLCKVKGYLYCTLNFFTRNKIVTVSQILNPDDCSIRRIMDNEEYDERMSMPLWQEVDTDDDLLDFA